MFLTGRREIHKPPAEYQRRLTLAGGLNRHNEPNFRIVWGWSRMDWIYSLRTHSYHLAPRYIVRPNRWYIEQWLPPERYGTPESWARAQTEKEDNYARSFELCGPYPRRGDYEMLLMLELPHANGCKQVSTDEYFGCLSCGGARFLQLSDFVIDNVVRLVERSRDVSERVRYNETLSQADREARTWEEDADDIIRDAQPVYELRPHVFLGHNNSLKEKFSKELINAS
jgi:hypothetical protein